jgi:hypothetical protein
MLPPSPLAITDELLQVFGAAFSMFTGIVVWRVRPYALKVVKLLLIIWLIAACVRVARFLWFFSASDAAVFSFPNEQFPLSVAHIVIALRPFLPLIGVVLWWSYFLKSKRVRATLGSNL